MPDRLEAIGDYRYNVSLGESQLRVSGRRHGAGDASYLIETSRTWPIRATSMPAACEPGRAAPSPSARSAQDHVGREGRQSHGAEPCNVEPVRSNRHIGMNLILSGRSASRLRPGDKILPGEPIEFRPPARPRMRLERRSGIGRDPSVGELQTLDVLQRIGPVRADLVGDVAGEPSAFLSMV